MTGTEALNRMIAPGTQRPGKWRGGVIQVWLTRSCNLSCFNCTQGSNLAAPKEFMSLDQVEQALQSLKGYFGVVGAFGGNPALHPAFVEVCELWRKYIPYSQRGLWCNDPLFWECGDAMRKTFNPAVSNLNVHLSHDAYTRFRDWWPEASPFGLRQDSRHSPVHLAMKDVIADEDRRWELISRCDINQHWSAMVCTFRGELRAFFCEVAGAQAMLHQYEPDYPDTGVIVNLKSAIPWWQLPMEAFTYQVRKHCHECGVPLRGYGELARRDVGGVEQTSKTHATVYTSKVKGRPVQVVDSLVQLNTDRISKFTDYIGNGGR